MFNDCIGVASAAEKPVMAHRFLDYLLNDDVAMENFTGYVGYQPPLNSKTPEQLVADGVVPAHLDSALVSRETYATGNAFLALTAQGSRLWDRGWQEFRAG